MITAAVIAGFGITAAWGVHGAVKGTPAKIQCEAVVPDDWLSLPPVFSADKIAAQLGVETALVEQGELGSAICEREITPEEVENGTAVVRVAQKGEECMAVGVQSERILPSKKIFAVCAATLISPIAR